MTGAPRQQSTQQPPDPETDLTGFPVRLVPAGTQWYREHGAQGPWFFAAGPGGRFNLDEPDGTLYLANRPEAAARERVGPDHVQHGLVPHGVVAKRWVSTLHLQEDVRAAHVNHDRAPDFRVVPELTVMRPYDTPRAWARAFARAAFDGVRSTLRHSSGTCRGLSVFGTAGPRDWPADPHPVRLTTLLEGMVGIEVVGAPALDEIQVIPAPAPQTDEPDNPTVHDLG